MGLTSFSCAFPLRQGSLIRSPHFLSLIPTSLICTLQIHHLPPLFCHFLSLRSPLIVCILLLKRLFPGHSDRIWFFLISRCLELNFLF